jgi:hypothetical protein
MLKVGVVSVVPFQLTSAGHNGANASTLLRTASTSNTRERFESAMIS